VEDMVVQVIGDILQEEEEVVVVQVEDHLVMALQII